MRIRTPVDCVHRDGLDHCRIKLAPWCRRWLAPKGRTHCTEAGRYAGPDQDPEDLPPPCPDLTAAPRGPHKPPPTPTR
ncbi:MAG: hypothetical protein LDL44_19740 [Caenispirillum sp.]|nr:hypothetical protein [Caenispirillum sp.]